MEIAQSDAAAYFDWYRIETWKGYDERPDTEVTGNPSDDYERRAPGLGGMWEGVRYQYYESSDGYILFMASEQAFWKNFCEGVDRMDLFEKWPGKRIADHARGNLSSRRSCATSSRPERSTSGSRSPTSTTPPSPRPTRRRRFATTRSSRTGSVDDARADECRRVAVPACTSKVRSSRSRTMAPTVGEHTDEVLSRVLGYDTERLAKLKATGALG